jgi:hypothetical protein
LRPKRWMAISVSPMARSTGAPRCVTPRMHKRNRKVPTTSQMKAEASYGSRRSGRCHRPWRR